MAFLVPEILNQTCQYQLLEVVALVAVTPHDVWTGNVLLQIGFLSLVSKPLTFTIYSFQKVVTVTSENVCRLAVRNVTFCTGSPDIRLEYESKINLPLSRVVCVFVAAILNFQ